MTMHPSTTTYLPRGYRTAVRRDRDMTVSGVDAFSPTGATIGTADDHEAARANCRAHLRRFADEHYRLGSRVAADATQGTVVSRAPYWHPGLGVFVVDVEWDHDGGTCATFLDSISPAAARQ